MRDFILATIPFALGYLAVITLWYQRPDTRWHERFRAVGHMALTNYLTQTIAVPGPISNATPAMAPCNENPRVRASSSTMSARYAAATEALPPVRPSTIRDTAITAMASLAESVRKYASANNPGPARFVKFELRDEFTNERLAAGLLDRSGERVAGAEAVKYCR